MYHSLTIKFEDGTEEIVLFVKSISIENNYILIDKTNGDQLIFYSDKIRSIYLKPKDES